MSSSRFIADNQMDEACLLFAELHGVHIVQRKLSRNLLLHLVSMHDFNLINTRTIDRAMARLRLLQNQASHTHRGQEEDEEEEEAWETAEESQPDPDLDPDASRAWKRRLEDGSQELENGGAEP